MSTNDTPIPARRNMSAPRPQADADLPSDLKAIDAPAIGRNAPQTTAPDCPILQWSSGHESGKFGAGRFTPFVGFHVEAGKDEAFDRSCIEAQVPRMEIKHQRPNGSAVVPHWSFGEGLRFHPVTSGPVARTIGGCVARRELMAQAGIGLVWPDGERSRMAVRGFIAVGLDLVLVQLSCRSKMTDALLAALLDHVRVCAAADSLIGRTKHPEVVTLHELALPLIAGAELTAGKGDTSQIVPFVSDHPSDAARPYITSCWRSPALHRLALESWDGIVSWAAGYGAERAEGGQS